MSAPAAVPRARGAREGPVSPSDPVGRLPGVSSARARALARLGVESVGDLLLLAPRRFEDRSVIAPTGSIDAGAVGGERTVIAHVASVRPGGWRVPVLEAVVDDGSGPLRVRWYRQPWLSTRVKPGARLLLHGPVAKGKDGRVHLSAPEVETLGEELFEPGAAGHPAHGRLVPVHPLTKNVSAAWLRRVVWDALRVVAAVDDPVPARCLGGGDPPLPALGDAVRAIHFPATLEAADLARRRLAYDELFVHEVLLARRRSAQRALEGIPFRWTPTLDRRIRRRFPFAPTPGQEEAIAGIVADLRRPEPMNRLLQGDVGSGKTAVATYACLVCVANRRQAAFMAPTEVLARQHQATLEAILRGSRVRVETLHGGMAAKERRAALRRIAEGEADLVVGTHAVISRGVEFARLGLAVVDEQHKFGVRQRRALVSKGPSPHCLVMTATPIPRTLALVVYGDLDVSLLRGRPPGRGATETWVVGPEDDAAVEARVCEEVARGRQAFVVYPLVRPSDRAGLADATRGQARWAKALPRGRVGLVHGQMPAAARAKAMEDFRRRRTDVLVATVVIEVGIDVPNATALVVEHAERFGLSQLHQLRGRVGRGPAGGLCVLVDRGSAGTPDRLRALASTEDGFAIAEADLRLRGAGDLFGTRQHGAPAFAAARFPDDLPLVLRAREVVASVLARDPSLDAPDLRGVRERVERRERALGDATTGG